MKSTFGPALLVLLAGCATVTGPGRPVVVAGRINRDTTRDFVVAIRQEHKAAVTPQSEPIAYPDAGIERSAAPPLDIQYAISITNRTKDPVTVRHITLEYRDVNRTVARRTRNYSKTIAPGAKEKFDFWLELHSNDLMGANPVTPAILPSQIEFEGPQGTRLESFVTPVSRPAA